MERDGPCSGQTHRVSCRGRAVMAVSINIGVRRQWFGLNCESHDTAVRLAWTPPPNSSVCVFNGGLTVP